MPDRLESELSNVYIVISRMAINLLYFSQTLKENQFTWPAMSATICSEKLFFSAKYVTTSVPGSESNFNMNILSVSHASTNDTYTRENRSIKNVKPCWYHLNAWP